MEKLKNALSGYKTYIVCAAAILTAVAGYATDTITAKELVEAIFAALAGMTLRAGVEKAK